MNEMLIEIEQIDNQVNAVISKIELGYTICEICKVKCNKSKNCDCFVNFSADVTQNGIEIISKGQNLITTTLRTLRVSKSTQFTVTNNEDLLSEKKSRRIISLNEVSEHDSYDDCWIVVYDRVYDVTNFLKEVDKNANEMTKIRKYF